MFALNIGLFAGLSALPLHAQEDENIPVGYNEDEWYNPGDWSDGNNIEATGSDSWDNNDWSNSAEYGKSTGNNAYGQTAGTGNQAGRNQQQNQSYKTSRNSQQGWSDRQTSQNQQQGWSGRNQQAHRSQGHSMKTVSFNGTVDGFKNVNLKNREGNLDEHTFVRIRLNDDETEVVSLGSRLIVSDLDLEKGDQISVSGRNARIDNRDVLVASRIEVDDKLFRIRKHNRPDTGQHLPIRGTVKDFSKTSLSDDSREENLLIRLELKNGKTCVVDLGQGTTLGDLDIEKGSEICLKGEKTKVNGKSLIVARMISVDGDRTRVRNKSQRNENTRRDKESPEFFQGDSSYDSLEPVSHD